MDTTTTPAAQEATMIRTADTADVLAAGREFPMRDALVRITPASAVALFQARRAFWLAAAAGYATLAAAGCSESAGDAAEARVQADLYAAR